MSRIFLIWMLGSSGNELLTIFGFQLKIKIWNFRVGSFILGRTSPSDCCGCIARDYHYGQKWWDKMESVQARQMKWKDNEQFRCISYLFMFGGLPNLPGVMDTFNFRFSIPTMRASCSPTTLYVNTAVMFPTNLEQKQKQWRQNIYIHIICINQLMVASNSHGVHLICMLVCVTRSMRVQLDHFVNEIMNFDREWWHSINWSVIGIGAQQHR